MQIGQYVVGQATEKYGLATVYGARHVSKGRAALLTVFSLSDETITGIWAARVAQIATLDHPNILAPDEHGQTGDNQWVVVTRWLPPFLSDRRILSPEWALALSEDISAALDHAHGRGIVHGRLRWIHVVELPDARAAVRGFELAGGQVPGKPSEDIVAFSEILRRALTGAGDGQLPPPVAKVLDKAAEFRTAQELHLAFSEAVDSLPPEQRQHPLVRASSVRRRRRNAPASSRQSNRLLLGVIVLAVLLVVITIGVIGGGLLITRRDQAAL